MERLQSVSPTLAAFGDRFPTKPELDAVIISGELAADVPRLNLEAHQALVGGDTAPVLQALPVSGESVMVERSVTPEDVPQLDKLALSSFVVDFSSVEKPRIGELDEAALHAYADSLCRQAGINVL